MANQEPKKSQVGSSSQDSYMLSWLKGIAVNPNGTLDSPKASFRGPLNQALRTTKLIALANPDCPPQRKRKLEKLLKRTESRTVTSPAPEGLNKGVPQISAATNLASPPDSVGKAFLSSMVGPVKVWRQPNDPVRTEAATPKPAKVPVNSFRQVTVTKWGPFLLPPLPPVHARNLFVKSPTPAATNAVADESTQAPNSASLGVVNSDEPVRRTKQGMIKKRWGLKILAKLVADTQNPSLNSEPKFPVAIGPECQAEVAEWKQPIKDVGSSKFLGAKVCPVEQNSTEESDAAEDGEGSGVGKGRPESCSCDTPGSLECIERHVCETLSRMKSELGPAFGDWKLGEMGDSVYRGGRKLRSRSKSKSARLG